MAFDFSAEGLPSHADWARAQVLEIRRLQAASHPDRTALVLAGKEFALGHEGIGIGDYSVARAHLERGFALLEDALRDLSAEQRAQRLSHPGIAAALRNAHYYLARILALASAGQDGPTAAARAIPPDEAARARDAAFGHLEEAIRLGWQDADHLKSDTDFVPLRADDRWSKLLAGLERPK